MKFGQVFGVLADVDEQSGFGRILVTLDTRTEVRTVRDEEVPLRQPPDGETLTEWNCDQYTQETIATTMAEEGWEVFGKPAQEQPDAATASYLVRLL